MFIEKIILDRKRIGGGESRNLYVSGIMTDGFGVGGSGAGTEGGHQEKPIYIDGVETLKKLDGAESFEKYDGGCMSGETVHDIIFAGEKVVNKKAGDEDSG